MEYYQYITFGYLDYKSPGRMEYVLTSELS